MTEWPEDWFRDGSHQAGASQPLSGSEAPTGPNPAVGGGPAGAGAGRAPAAAEPTVQLPFGSGRQGRDPGPAATAAPGGYPGGPGVRPAGGWPDQPALQTPGRPPRGPAPRPDRRGGAGGTGGAGGAGGGFPPGTSRPAGWRRWLRPRRIIAIIAVIVSVALIGGIAMYFYLDSKLTKQNILVDYSGRPPLGAGQNWLITGSDSRQGLTRAQERKLATGHDIGGRRSDTILVLHVPASGGRPVLVSLPRDSWVPIPGYGENKINAAYSFGGPKLLAQTVQNVTGLHIDHYMGIGFGGFVHVVDAIGGVRICLKAPLNDPAAGLHLRKGCQVLNGAEALGFVRTRHKFATQDLQRIQNQRVFIRALLRKLTSAGVLLNPFSVLPAASGVAGTLTVDKSTSLSQLLTVAFALRNPITTTVPIGNSNYIAPNGQDALLWDRTAALQLFRDLRTDHPLPKSLITGSSVAG